jgi:cytidyltransferase-like protein
MTNNTHATPSQSIPDENQGRVTSPMVDTSRISVVSGYFNPIHVGHIRLINGAKTVAPYLIVIVNSDHQQLAKKGRIIMREGDRLEVASAIKGVDEAFIAVDVDDSVADSLTAIRSRYPEAEITFCNGGDRSAIERLPGRESAACKELGIAMRYGVGGEDKPDSSTRIIEALASSA